MKDVNFEKIENCNIELEEDKVLIKKDNELIYIVPIHNIQYIKISPIKGVKNK